MQLFATVCRIALKELICRVFYVYSLFLLPRMSNIRNWIKLIPAFLHEVWKSSYCALVIYCMFKGNTTVLMLKAV